MATQAKVLIKEQESTVIPDTNQNPYKKVVFSTVEKVETPLGDIIVKGSKVGKKNCWETSYIGNLTEQEAFKAPIYNGNPAQGGVFLGDIVTREVPEYEIDGMPRNTYTAVVFGNTTNAEAFELEVKRTFMSAGHNLAYLESKAPDMYPIQEKVVEKVIETEKTQEEVEQKLEV